jgi:hypothetical protein
MTDDTSQNKIVFEPSGRKKIHCTVNGPTIYYTYADEDSQIPKGMRRCTFLETDPYQQGDTE